MTVTETVLVPEIKTKRLVLSAFTPADKDAVFAYASHPRIAETVTWEAHRTVAESLAFIEMINSKIEIKSEAEHGGNGKWIQGYDTRLLETIKTDIMGKVGRTTR